MKRLLLLALLLPLSACDSTDEANSESTALTRVTAREKAVLSASDAAPFTLSLDQRGNAKTDHPGSSESDPYVLDASALWVSGMQGGALRTAQTLGRSTYAPCGDGTGGVFHLFADTTYSAESWPAAQGAPVDASGAPRVYGDEMLWTTSCQSPADAQGLTLFDGLRTNVALFRHSNTPNTVFARYEIINTSASAMTDVSVGLYSDPDLALEGIDIYDNLVGLDVARALGYVYFDQVHTGGSATPDGTPRTDAKRGRVAGVTLLETPRSIGLTGHRIMRKAGIYEEPKTYENTLYSSALQTLFNDGSAQVNWTTGLPDKLAYTGDPVAMTGWLDGTGPVRLNGTPENVQSGTDTRMLLSSGSFSLAPGERTTLTVAWVMVNEPSLDAGLGALRQRVSSVRASPALWTF